MNELQKSILRTLAYYDVFRFPLKDYELLTFGTFTGTKDDLQRELNALLITGIVREMRGYYFLADTCTSHVEAREVNQIRADAALKKVKRFSTLISRFPFIEAVCISGSFSKGVLDRYGDVDYFLIAKPGRLWIARTLLILFKKIFLFNSRRYFCINYLIDSNSLEIPDKNIFTATEILTLIPMSGGKMYAAFIRQNTWAKSYLPNRLLHTANTIPATAPKGILSRLIQFLLKGKVGDSIDEFCFRITYNRWKKKFPHLKEEEFELNLRSRRNVSKHHPRGFQYRVLSTYRQKLNHLMVEDEPKLVVA
ncbi:MAG: nucleotidyltransferase domain-containing protein [Bacteroidetes bacterium]|nr:nucleotidyltransferase domain-containing protein [Bacteroidota bacterium]